MPKCVSGRATKARNCMQAFRNLHYFVYLAVMKRTLTLITLLLALLPAAAQVRIVHKGAMTGCFKPGHPGGTAAEKEAIDLAAHFFLAESLTKTAPWAKAVRKGDIVLCETDTEEYGEDGCRIVIDNRNVRIYGHGKGLVSMSASTTGEPGNPMSPCTRSWSWSRSIP